MPHLPAYAGGGAKCTTDAIRVALSSTSARSTQLTQGHFYDVSCDQDCRIKQGDSSVTVTSTTGVVLWAKSAVRIYADDHTSLYLAGVVDFGTATLEISQVI